MMAGDNQLYPEDQQRVDEFVKSGVNKTERKPFKPLQLLLFLLLVVAGFSFFSLWLAEYFMVY